MATRGLTLDFPGSLLCQGAVRRHDGRQRLPPLQGGRRRERLARDDLSLIAAGTRGRRMAYDLCIWVCAGGPRIGRIRHGPDLRLSRLSSEVHAHTPLIVARWTLWQLALTLWTWPKQLFYRFYNTAGPRPSPGRRLSASRVRRATSERGQPQRDSHRPMSQASGSGDSTKQLAAPCRASWLS